METKILLAIDFDANIEKPAYGSWIAYGLEKTWLKYVGINSSRKFHDLGPTLRGIYPIVFYT